MGSIYWSGWWLCSIMIIWTGFERSFVFFYWINLESTNLVVSFASTSYIVVDSLELLTPYCHRHRHPFCDRKKESALMFSCASYNMQVSITIWKGVWHLACCHQIETNVDGSFIAVRDVVWAIHWFTCDFLCRLFQRKEKGIEKSVRLLWANTNRYGLAMHAPNVCILV